MRTFIDCFLLCWQVKPDHSPEKSWLFIFLKMSPLCAHVYWLLVRRCGSRTGARSGGNASATSSTRARTSARAASGPSSTGWCSRSTRKAWPATATPPTTTGLPRCPRPPSPRALPGDSTLRSCTTNPGICRFPLGFYILFLCRVQSSI